MTLALLKPHIVKNPVAVSTIKEIIKLNGISILKEKSIFIKRKDAEIFYKEHKEKFFYNRLVSSMSR